MTSDGYTNKEANERFGIKSIKDVVKRHECLNDEITIARPKLPTTMVDGLKRLLDYKHSIFFDCPVCLLGKFMVDQRKQLQYRQCSHCYNVYSFKKDNFGDFKFRFEPDVQPNPFRSDF